MQSQPPADAAIDSQDDNSDSFALSFADLVNESLQIQADTKRLKEGRKALKDKRAMPASEYEQLLADLKRIEVAREWQPRAAVAMFQVQHCKCCDNYNPVFTGLFQRQQNRHHRDADRWIAATESENFGLRREVKTTEIDIPFCAMCLAQNKWPADQLGIVFDDEDKAPADAVDEVLAAIEANSEMTDDEKLQASFEYMADATAEAQQLPLQ